MRYFLVIFVLTKHICAFAFEDDNNYRFIHITAADGLPNSIVHSIYQGDKGFLWIGTNNGLARYDGYEFKVFQPEPFNDNSISHKSIESIIQDNDGKLWLLSQSKTIDCFNPKTGKVQHYPGFSTSLASAERKSTSFVYKDVNGNLWFGSNSGALVFDYKRQSFRDYKTFKGKNIGKVYAIRGDKNSNIFIGSESGLYFISPGSKIISQIPAASVIRGSPVSDLLVDKDNNLWVTTYNKGYFCFKAKTFELVKLAGQNSITSLHSIFESKKGDIYFVSNRPQNKLLLIKYATKFIKPSEIYTLSKIYMAEFFNFAEDACGNIWFSATNGLFKFNPEVSEITHFKNDPSLSTTIADNNAGPLFIDRSNVLWVGIYKIGIDKLDLNQKPFRFLTKKNDKSSSSLPENNILSVLEDKDGNIWMGTFNSGIVIKEKQNNKFTYLNSPGISAGEIKMNAISALHEDKQGKIWAGSFYGGISMIDPVTRKIKHFDQNSHSFFKASIIRKIIEDRNGNLWIVSTSHGLVEYRASEQKFHYHSEKNDTNFLDYGFYRTCYEDKIGRIWVGTQSGGILIFDKKGGLLKHLLHDQDDYNSIISNTIYSFFQDEQGIMWIGTASGLDAFNEVAGNFIHYTTQNGLASNTIYSIINDNQNNLWINTDFGLSRFDKKNETFKNFYESDGLISSDFNSTASYKGKNNILYFGTSKGLLFFNPEEIKSNPNTSAPVITGLKIFNKEINPGDKVQNRVITNDDIIYCKKITLSYKEYLFSLAFSTLNYSSTANIKYQYKLDPFDKGWFLTDARQRWGTYSNLKPGTYTFRVKATNSDGDWQNNNKEATLLIEILPPFWSTWWFRALMVIIIIASAGLIYYSRVRRLKINQKKLEILVANRTHMWEESNLALEEQKREILLQKEKLELNNKLLREQQDRILHQNIELDTHRHHLEQMVEDRTKELKEAREKAEESSRLKSAFLANMSHEIRTPMNAIVGFANLISTNEFPEEQKKEFINIIKKNSEALLVIIDDILDLSKIQSKQLMIVPKPFELRPLLMEIYNSFLVSVKAKKLDLFLFCDYISEQDALYTDPVRLKQILINLVNNAIKFTDEGSISFGIQKIENGFIHFFIKDTGYGIPPEWHEAIFERFIKVSANPGENHTGAGLGLAISKSLVELLGGRIWFESKVDEGTSFYFTIPNLKTQPEHTTKPNLTNSGDQDKFLKGRKILIVEDEEANYKILLAFLRIKQVTTLRVTNGLEAIELLKEDSNFDAILMDIRMPVMDGITALKHIRELNIQIPVIAQTAYATVEEKAEFQSHGFCQYLVKPISQFELYKVLFEVLCKK